MLKKYFDYRMTAMGYASHLIIIIASLYYLYILFMLIKFFKKFVPKSFKDVLRVVLVIRNWPEILLVRLKIFEAGGRTAYFRNGYQFKFEKNQWNDLAKYIAFFREVPDGVLVDGERATKISYGGRELTLYFGEFGPNVFTEIFRREPYRKFLEQFSIKNRDVVDVGAAFGDTAIYFALWGARKVFAFEPLPALYALAVKNIKENMLEDRCKIIQAGVGGARGFLTDDSTYQSILANYKEIDKYIGRLDTKIPIVALEDIVSDFKLKSAVLKMDCEGFEYDIVSNATEETLRHFDYIFLEYHYGFEKLEEKLRAVGFLVQYTEPRHVRDFNRVGDKRNMAVGFLSAQRI